MIPKFESIPCQMVKLGGKQPDCCCLLHCLLNHADKNKEVRIFLSAFNLMDATFTDLVCKCICFKDMDRIGASEIIQDKKGWLFRTLKNLNIKMSTEEVLKVSSPSVMECMPSIASKFSNQQMERLCEAIAMVPLRDEQNIQLKNRKIKELAVDQGFDFEVFNERLQDIVR